jgi:hypothetical protein
MIHLGPEGESAPAADAAASIFLPGSTRQTSEVV